MIRQNIVFVENRAESLKKVTNLLTVIADSNINLDYIYTSFHRQSLVPAVILQAEDIFVTESILKNNGFTVFDKVDELER